MQRSPEDIQDELLVLRCQGGDGEALNALVSRWHPRLLRFAARLTNDANAGRDVAQDAWMAILQGLRRLEDPARFRVWAYRVMRNKCADWTRRRATHRLAVSKLRCGMAGRSDDGGQPTADHADEVSRMRVALRGLPDDERAMLALHSISGLGVLEIATIFGLSVGTVKSRLYSARERLRQAMEVGTHE
jgi:RNA polymerase sigma-70 factor (ECF subfamily)